MNRLCGDMEATANGNQQFFLSLQRRIFLKDLCCSEVINISQFSFFPAVLAPLALIPFFQLSIFYFAIRKKKWLVSTNCTV